MRTRTAIAVRPPSIHDPLIARMTGESVDPADFISAVRILYDAHLSDQTGADLEQMRELVRRSWSSTAFQAVDTLNTALGYVVAMELENRQPKMVEPGTFGLSGVRHLIDWMETGLGFDHEVLAQDTAAVAR